MLRAENISYIFYVLDRNAFALKAATKTAKV